MDKFFRWKVRGKLFFLTGIFIFGLVVYAAISYFLIETIKIKGPYYEQIIQSKDLIADILPPPGYIIEFYLLANLELDETDPTKLDELIKRSQTLEKEYEEAHQKWEKILPASKLRDLFINQSHLYVEELFKIWRNDFVPNVMQKKREEAAVKLGEMTKVYQEHRAIIDIVVKDAKEENMNLEAEVTRLYNRNQTFAVTAWMITFVLGIFLAFMVARSINNPLQKAVSGLDPICVEISMRLDQQAKAVAQQSSSVHETTSTMDELNTSFQHTEALAQESSHRAKAALQISETGTNCLKQVINILSTHKEKVSAIVEQILRLSELVRQIHNMAAITSNLTNQTNILALNAAVQAAHVKQQSEGFSVIAREIRKLADESKKFLSRIDGLAEDIQQATDSTVKIAEEGNNTVREIIVQTQETAKAFESLISITNKSFEGAEEASLNVQQQGIAVHQVLEAMENLNAVAHQTLSGMQLVREELNKLNLITQDIKIII